MVEPIAPATASIYGWTRPLMPRIDRYSKPGSMVTRGRKRIDYIQRHTHRHSLLITWLLLFFNFFASSFTLHATTTTIAITNIHNKHISGVKPSRVLNASRVWDHSSDDVLPCRVIERGTSPVHECFHQAQVACASEYKQQPRTLHSPRRQQ